jgi:restriction endonuclease S subunit
MSTLPQGWTRAALGEVISIRSGYAFRSADFCKHGVPVVRQSNLTGNLVDLSDCVFVPAAVAKDASRFVVRRGDLLLGMSGSIGEPSVYPYDFEAVQNQRTGLVQFFMDDSGHREFIKQALAAFELEYTNRGKGVGIQNVSAKDIQSTEIPLPPLAEQQRIVAKIDSLSTKSNRARDQLDHVPALVKRYKRAILDRAFRRFRNRQKLVRLVVPDRGIPYGIIQTGKPTTGGIPTVRGGDIKGFRVSRSELKEVDPAIENNYRRTRLQGGEVLIAIRGSVGEPCVVPPEMKGCNISREVAMIPMREGISPKFVMYYLASSEAKEFILGNIKGAARYQFR